MGPLLAELARARNPMARLRALDIEPVHRRVTRYSIDFGNGLPPWQLVGKVYESAALGQAGFDALRRLWQAGFHAGAGDGIHVPEPYAFEPGLCLLLMQAVPAQELRALLKQGVVPAGTASLFARATAKLHRCAAPPGARFGVDDYLLQREQVSPQELAAAHGDLAGTIEAVLQRARRWHESLSELTSTAAHGDYHLGQAQVADGRLWLFDLDRLHCGDPMADLAAIFVDLRGLERKPERIGGVRALLATFLETYFAAGDWAGAGRIPLYAALIHLKKAAKHHRWREDPDWQARLGQQVAHAATCLDVWPPGRPPASLDDVLDIYRACPMKA